MAGAACQRPGRGRGPDARRLSGPETRRVPGGPQTYTYEITEHDPPRKASFRVLDGPIRPSGTITVEPVGDGARSRLTLELDFDGVGMGKLLAPLARRNARKQIPKNQATLRELLERGTA